MFRTPAWSRCLPASAFSLLPVSALSTASRRAVLTLGCFAALLAPSFARAQNPGDLDPSFTSVLLGSSLYALALVDVGGNELLFSSGDFGVVGELAADGSDAEGFTIPAFGNVNRLIYTAVPEVIPFSPVTGPKLLLGGLFGRDSTQVTAMTTAQNIFRILPDGTVDTTFNPGTGANAFVTAILPLPDGGMVVGGEFTVFNKQSHPYIVRLDGTGAIVDNSVFDTSLNFNSYVLSLAAQQNPDTTGAQGQILAAGTFSAVNGKPHAHLARINADGTLDDSFQPDFDDRVRIVVSQSDGKILAGGDFFHVNGVAAAHLVRLNYDGSVDTTFSAQVTDQPPLIAAPVAVNAIVPFSGGRYYIGGNFARINGVARNYLGAVLADGTVDTFDPGTTITNAVEQVQIDKLTNRVYVSEARSKQINNVYPPSLIRLYGDVASAPKVSVVATQPTLSSTGAAGAFTFSRTDGDLANALTVYFTRGGSGVLKVLNAKKHGDYKLSPAPAGFGTVDGEQVFSVTFPVDVTTLTVAVKETKNASPGATVQFSLVPDENATALYVPGGSETATVTLIKP